MYLITITITCNHKNHRLQITFRLLKICNQLHVITITDYNYNRSGAVHCILLTYPLEVIGMLCSVTVTLSGHLHDYFLIYFSINKNFMEGGVAPACCQYIYYKQVKH